MSSLINRIMKLSPYPELLIRKFYWNPALHQRLAKAKLRKNLVLPNVSGESILDEEDIPKVMAEISERAGISKGDLLLVHSSMAGMGILSPRGLEAVYDGLKEMVGESGTIAMPVFPKYKYPCSREEIMERERTDDDFTDITLTYDYLKKNCWTGALNQYFLSQPNVIRSKFPNNPLAARGPLAEAMMERDFDNDLPHGKGSSWEFCITHNAKILFLGLPADHCFSLVHTAEDILDSEWPVNGWYKKQKYRIVDKDSSRDIVVRERKMLWVRYVTEKYSIEKLRRLGLLHTRQVAGRTIEIIDDANEVFQYLKKCALQGKPFYFHVPKNCLKKPR